MDRRDDDKPELCPTLVPRDAVILTQHYPDILATFPDAQFVMDGAVLRFRPNKIFEWISKKMCGLVYNDMSEAYQLGKFSLDEYMDFYQGTGYSLGGFLDIFGDEVDAMVAEGRILRAGGRPEKKEGWDGPTIVANFGQD